MPEIGDGRLGNRPAVGSTIGSWSERGVAGLVRGLKSGRKKGGDFRSPPWKRDLTGGKIDQRREPERLSV